MHLPLPALESANLSHENCYESLDETLCKVRERIIQTKDLPYVTVERQLDLLSQLAEFDLGRFLLQTGGLNGYWTHYVINHPKKDHEGKKFNSVESFILTRAPFALATQERYQIFKQEIQKRLKNNTRMASIPCGVMGDLLDLNFEGVSNYHLVGIDIDEESLHFASRLAKENNLINSCEFIKKDAWHLDSLEEYDLITSNGLSIYEQSDDRVKELYSQFFKALKSEGILVTSFLSQPPLPGVQTGWLMEKVNLQDVMLQKVIFADILQSKWQAFRSEETVRKLLEEAGFVEIYAIYDRAHIFPTIVAKKP